MIISTTSNEVSPEAPIDYETIMRRINSTVFGVKLAHAGAELGLAYENFVDRPRKPTRKYLVH